MLIEALTQQSPEFHRCVEIVNEAHAIWMRKNGNMSVHDMATMKKLKAEGWALLKNPLFR